MSQRFDSVAELAGDAFRSKITVDHAAGFQAAQRDGHVQGVDDEFSAMVIGPECPMVRLVARSSHEAR